MQPLRAPYPFTNLNNLNYPPFLPSPKKTQKNLPLHLPSRAFCSPAHSDISDVIRDAPAKAICSLVPSCYSTFSRSPYGRLLHLLRLSLHSPSYLWASPTPPTFVSTLCTLVRFPVFSRSSFCSFVAVCPITTPSFLFLLCRHRPSPLLHRHLLVPSYQSSAVATNGMLHISSSTSPLQRLTC